MPLSLISRPPLKMSMVVPSFWVERSESLELAFEREMSRVEGERKFEDDAELSGKAAASSISPCRRSGTVNDMLPPEEKPETAMRSTSSRSSSACRARYSIASTPSSTAVGKGCSGARR